MPTHRVSLGIRSLNPTRNIAGEAADTHLNSVRRLIINSLPRFHLHLRFTTPARRWTILEDKRITTRLSHCLKPAQKVVCSICLLRLYGQGSLLKMGAFTDPLPELFNANGSFAPRSFRTLDSPNSQQPLSLHTSPQPRGGVGRASVATGYLQAGPSPPGAGTLKRVRSREDSVAYDHNPSGDDYDQQREDSNRTKS